MFDLGRKIRHQDEKDRCNRSIDIAQRTLSAGPRPNDNLQVSLGTIEVADDPNLETRVQTRGSDAITQSLFTAASNSLLGSDIPYFGSERS